MGSRVKGIRDEVLKDFADKVIEKAQLNLGVVKSYRSKATGKTYRKRLDASKRLRNSLDGEVKVRAKDGRFVKGFVSFKMLDYGNIVDKGRKAGKGISEAGQKSVIEWIKKKPLKLRDADGKFVKLTDARLKGMAYVISRNMKKYGKEPTNFFTDAYTSQEELLFESLQDRIADDQIDYIGTQLDIISSNGTST